MSEKESLFGEEGTGYCPKNCGTRLWMRQTVGAKVIHATCPVCFQRQVGGLSVESAVQYIDVLLEGYQAHASQSREVRRLQHELELLREDVIDGGDVDTDEFQETLIKAIQVLQVESQDDEPVSTLERLQGLRANMIQLEATLRKQQEMCTDVSLPMFSSQYALLDVLYQLEQVKTSISNEKSLKDFNELLEEVNSLQIELLLVQRTMEHAPGVLSGFSKNVTILNEQFTSLKEEMRRKNKECIVADSKRTATNESIGTKTIANESTAGTPNDLSYREEIEQLEQQVKELRKQSDPSLLQQILALQSQLNIVSASIGATGAPLLKMSPKSVQKKLATTSPATWSEPTFEVSPHDFGSGLDERKLPARATQNDWMERHMNEATFNNDSPASPRSVNPQTLVPASPVASPSFSQYTGTNPALLDGSVSNVISPTDFDAAVPSFEDPLAQAESEYMNSDMPVATMVTSSSPSPSDSVDGRSYTSKFDANSQDELKTLREKIDEMDSVPNTLSLMWDNPNDVDVQTMACQRLGTLAKVSAKNRNLIRDGGGIELVLTALQGQHRNVPLIVENGLKALVNMALGSAQNRSCIVSAGGIPLIMEALEAHPDNVAILTNGLICLGNWAYDAKSSAMIGQCGGIELVCNVLREHRDVAGIQQCGLHALNNLASYNPENKATIDNAGGIELALCAIEAYPKNCDIQLQGLCTIERFSAGRDMFKAKIVDLGGIPLVLSVLEANPDVADIQKHGLLALSELVASSTEKKMVAVKEDAVEITVEALKAHPNAAGVQRAGLLALGVLVFNDESIVKTAKAGGVDILLETIQRFPGNAEIIKWACKVIKILSKSHAIQRRLRKKGAIRIVSTAAENHPDNLDGYAEDAIIELRRTHSNALQ